MHNIQITKMTLLDFGEISDCLTTDFDDFWTANILKSELENKSSIYIVAKLNSEIVGFAGIWDGIDQMHITNIVVKKSFRRKGIANLLLNELISITKDLNKSELTLEVNELNIPAQNLYLKNGFKNLGLRKNYYNNSENAIIMTLYIS